MAIQEPQPRAAMATGHDAPVGDRADDFYDRWAIATAISRVIESSPPEWSTRIGLFGRWGDGKTSVLNFLEKQQRDVGNIVIKYSPWGASTEAQVWKNFGVELIKGLSANGIPLRLRDRLLQRFRRHGEKIAAGTKVAGKIAQASGHAPGAQAGTEYASNLIRNQLQLQRRDVERILGQLGNCRIVVFIDDLDRADPAVVPKLLLALRELLDFSRFAFVLAFDRQIVARALQSYNTAWESSGNDFLDKVIDFPFELPAPSLTQIKRLALAQFRTNCAFVPLGAIDEIDKLLPSNPRKLKLFVRMIASMKEEATRHEADELDWPVILVFALLRAESEAFANELLAKIVDSWEFRWVMPENDGEQDKQAVALKALIGSQPDLKGIETRMTALAEGLRERCSSQPDERLRYQALFALSPHCITWGEFKAFLAKWRPTRAIGITRDFIIERAKATENENGTVETDTQYCYGKTPQLARIDTARLAYGKHLERVLRRTTKSGPAALYASSPT